MPANRRPRPSGRRDRVLALLTGIVLLTGILPAGAMATPITDARPATSPAARTPDGIQDVGRVVEREPIELGSRTNAAGAAGGAASGDIADPSVELRTAPTPVADVKELWTERSQTSLNTDGSYTLETALGRMNFRDPAGDWQQIDLTLVAETTDRYGLRTTANDRDVRFGVSDAQAALAGLTTSQGSLGLRVLDFPSKAVSAPTGPVPAEPAAEPPVAEPPVAEPPAPESAASEPAPPDPDGGEPPVADPPADGAGPAAPAEPTPDPAEAAGAAPSPATGASAVPADGVVRFAKDDATGQVTARATDTGFEFGAVLDRADQANVYAFALDLGGLTAALSDDGQTIILSGTARGEGGLDPAPVGGISAPVMLDANEVPAPPKTVGVELYLPDGDAPLPAGVSPEALATLAPTEVVVVYSIDRGYLADPSRAFPVTLDPDACLGEGASGCDINGTGTNFDHFVASGLGSSYPSGWTVFRVGYDVRSDDGDVYNTMRGMVYFQDVALPDGAMPYDTNLKLHISSEYGGPSGETINAYRITKGWGQTTSWTGWGSGTYTTTGGASDTVPSSGSMNVDVDAIVQSWYTRRGKDWQGDLGFAIKMSAEGSSHGEVEFDRYNDGTASYRPLLTIHYEAPAVSIGFDPALGPNYAPATMLAGQPTTLPIRITNDAPSLAFNTTDWRVGYRWFDQKGNLVTPGVSQALTQCIGVGTGCANPTSGTIGLAVTPPAAVGQYTLRLDLVRNGTIDTFASDWAKPSKYLSRNKNSLSADDTRWTGSSVIERDEFGIAVVDGPGDERQTVATGDGGELGVDLWSKGLSYEGAGGVGFDDLTPMALDYRYDSRATGDCTGILDACGWSTTWDERFVPGSSPDAMTYVGPSGTRYLVSADSDQQLVSGAPVLLQRPRTTLVDEVTPSNSPTASLVAPSFGAFSGQYSVSVAANTLPGVSLGAVGTTNLNTYRFARFAMRSSGPASAGLAFKIHNATKGTDRWFIYTVGTNWTTGFSQVALGGTITGSWVYYNRNLYQDVRDDGNFGSTYDDYQVTALQVQNVSGSSSGSIYLDGLRLEAGSTMMADGDAITPTWSSGATTLVTDDVAVGGHAIRVAPAPIASSPDCNTTAPATPCWSPSAGGLYGYGFVRWQWKKVGGSVAAIVFHLKDLRTSTTGDLTYYAGPTAPVGASNPIQVSDVTPAGWGTVTRNLLEDARQVLNFYNDNAGGSSPSAPPSQGPTPDDVRMIGYRLVALDGSLLLVDDLSYASLPDVGADEATHPSSVGDPTALYDFTATYGDGAVHYFNAAGVLERIIDRDGHTAELDWSIPDLAVPGAAGYRLEAIHAPSDGSTAGGLTYDRQIDVGYGGSSPRTVSFSEVLASTGTGGVSATGRSTVFTVATTGGGDYSSGDVTRIKPARAPSCAASGSPSGCDLFGYSGSYPHMLAFVGDPRWDQTSTSGAGDQRFEIAWAGTAPGQYPTAIKDRSTGGSGGTPILRVVTYDEPGAELPAATRATWQDAAGVSTNYARFVDLTSDGRTLAEYIPLACGASACGSSPSTASLSSKVAREHRFDGLARVSSSIDYRCPGVSVSGCSGTAQQVVSRQGTKAGAKVDNYNDPLTAGLVGWTQSPDQYLGSLRDSGGLDPDLYRTTYAYDEHGQQVSASRPARNERPAYAAAIGSTATTGLLGHWRLAETSGTTAADQAPSPHAGTYTGDVSLDQAAALVNDTDRAAGFDGTNDFVAVPTSLGTVSGSFTAEAWIKPSTDTTTSAFIGSRKSNTAGTDYSFDAKLFYDAAAKIRYLTVDLGNGTAWLLNTNVPFDYQAGRWYHIVVVVDDAADQVRVYRDGQQLATVAWTGATTPLLADASRPLRIGNNGRDSITPQWFAGSIDEVAIYGRALSGPQVVAHHLAGRSIARVTTATLYDRSWRPIQVDDEFLASPGFESGLGDWETSGSAGLHVGGTSVSGDDRLHQPGDPTLPASWQSFETATTGVARQIVSLVPGQTFRVQAWDRRIGGSGSAVIDVSYWPRSGGTWTTIAGGTFADASWTGHAWDVTLPFDTDGRVRLSLSSSGVSGSNTIVFDDAAILTTYGRTTYTSTGAGDPFDGLVRDTVTFSPSASIAEYLGRTSYAATTAAPAIFPTTSIANYVDGGYSAAAPDTDVATTSTYDAWGHRLSSTDQDGVSTMDTYESSTSAVGYATDVIATTNGLGETTSFAYDRVGNRTSVTSPLSEVTATTYDLRGHPLTVTAPAPVSTVSKDVYDAYGLRTTSIANRVDDTPSGASGLDDLTTTYAYDEYGIVTSSTANTGVGSSPVGARTTSLHDLLGNETSTTVYSTYDGSAFGGARTTTQRFEVLSGVSRPQASAIRGPGALVPAGGPAPTCPDGSGEYCNAVATLDQDGQATASTDTYGTVTRTFRDLAGRPVFVVANYGDGVYSGAAPAVDLVTRTRYDLFGRPASVTDTLGRETVATFDALGRTTRTTAYDWNGSSATAVTDSLTTYTGAGRVDRTSLPGAAGGTTTAYTWAKTVYDKAGRATRTLDHYDTTGAAGLAIDSFETPISDDTITNDGIAERWSDAAGSFIAAGASASREAAAASAVAGSGRLSITTGTGANTGAEWALDGTFAAGDQYQARVWVDPPSGTSVSARLGVAADAGTPVTVNGTGAWQAIDLTWTPSASQTGVRLAVYRAAGASAVTFHADDAIVWDSTSGRTDWNIPTETAYDADGRVVASIITPGTLGAGEEPLVTRTAYDALGRPTSVTVNEIAGAGTSDPAVNLTSGSTYDALGRVATSTDATGTVTRFGYDRLGRQSSTIANYVDGTAGTATSDDDVQSTFAYDAASELVGYCPAAQIFAGGCDPATGSNAQAWHYAYDDAGRMARQTPPVNTTATALASTLWEYEAGGRLAKGCDGPATITSCASAGVLRTRVPDYDDVGRVTRLRTYSGPSTTLALQTDLVYLGDGQPAQTKFSTGTTPTVVDTIDHVYDTLGRQTQLKRGSTVLAEAAYNPDGTLASRNDGDGNAVGQSTFGYDWAKRLVSVDLPNTFSTAVPTFAWRLDGLVGSRTWSGTTATFAYDGAKRVTGLAKGSLTLSQAYDRDGNVTSEARAFPGVSGDPGTGTQSFSYDALDRLTASSGLASGSRSYAYDRDGNRVTKTEGGTTYSSTFDRTDQLVSVTKGILPVQSFSYDPYGNLTGDAQTGSAVTAMSYDLADHLTGIDPAGTADDTAFTLDALGRFVTRTVNGTTDSYSYVGASETVARIGSGGTNTDSIVSPAGERLGVAVGGTTNWFVPDLHGDIAGSLDAAETTVVSAIRYDAYGQTVATGSGGGSAVGTGHWGYQGRLDVSPQGLGTPLYDLSARFYAPGLGAFTQLDSVMGSAQDPISMNRFLYAEANPATLIDPTGHDACSYDCATDYDNGGRSRGNHDVAPAQKAFARAHHRTPTYRRDRDRRDEKRDSYRVRVQSGADTILLDREPGLLASNAARSLFWFEENLDEIPDVGTPSAEVTAKLRSIEKYQRYLGQTDPLASEAFYTKVRAGGYFGLFLASHPDDPGDSPLVLAAAGTLGGGREGVRKTFQTYVKPSLTGGAPYSGRTSGFGRPEQNVARRDLSHHMNGEFGPARLDRSSTNPDAIRGREQRNIDRYGGAQSVGGTSGNRINGISPRNRERTRYLDAADEFDEDWP